MQAETKWETHQWEKHGPLKVPRNGHSLEFEDATGFLWLGDTAWQVPGCVLKALAC